MEDKATSFDHLVAGLSSDDRMSLLQRLKIDINLEKEILISDERLVGIGECNLKEALKKESIFLQIWIFLKSLFSSADLDKIYNDYCVLSLAKKINSKYPNIIDPRNLTLVNGFYENFLELRQVSQFFKRQISEYEEDSGKFLVLLGSLVMPDLAARIEQDVSPYSIPFSDDAPVNLRAILFRKMEIILSEISSADKAKLYASVQWLEWLKELVNLPYDRLYVKFSPNAEGKITCSMQSALKEITQFAEILCNGKKIHTEALQALYMFQVQSRITAGESVNVQKEVAIYLQKSMDNIAVIKQFITNVPIRSIGAICNNSCLWVPTYDEGVEDWFVRYKAYWHKIFKQKWSLWLYDQNLIKIRDHIASLFGVTDYPLIPNRPWEGVWSNLTFSKGYSLGILYAFFTQLYPAYNEVLKILVVNGQFIFNKNRIEFTDAYSDMSHLVETVHGLNMKLAEKGVYGQVFRQIDTKSLRTIQGQMKMQSFMRSIEAEANLIILSFNNLCVSLTTVLGGILTEKRSQKYESISNLAILLGPDSDPIRNDLLEVHTGLLAILTVLKEVEMVESHESPEFK